MATRFRRRASISTGGKCDKSQSSRLRSGGDEEIFMTGRSAGTVDALNIEELRQATQARLPAGVYAFLERGVEDDISVAANRAAFCDIKLRPRVLRGVANIDLSTEILGQRVCAPVAIAPTGGNGMLWYRGDEALARAAAAAGIPFTISTASSIDVEELARAGGGRGFSFTCGRIENCPMPRWTGPGWRAAI